LAAADLGAAISDEASIARPTRTANRRSMTGVSIWRMLKTYRHRGHPKVIHVTLQSNK
jgi:hypothetical protein